MTCGTFYVSGSGSVREILETKSKNYRVVNQVEIRF